jgi:hypothetical protein
MRYSVPFAKKPIERLSGDQNGNVAPSVPGSGSVDPLINERVHNFGR